MSRKFSLAALVLAFVCMSARAEDKPEIVGKWEGKSGKGKVVAIDFKEDKSVEMSEDGKVEAMPGVTIKWELVDAAKGHLDIVMSAEGKDIRIPMIYELKDGKLKMGGPKEEGKRPATVAESDDPVEFSKK